MGLIRLVLGPRGDESVSELTDSSVATLAPELTGETVRVGEDGR